MIILLLSFILIIFSGIALYKKSPRVCLFFYSGVILALSYASYYKNYHLPNSVFWDENYHIASAYKYIYGIRTEEYHPPLGRILIALGEYLIHPNKDVNTEPFSTTYYIKNKDFPVGFSFAGVRIIPTLLAALSSILLFLLLFFLVKNIHYSFLFTSLYLFDNALIVHSRAAMLEGPQIFFMLLSLIYFVYIIANLKNFKIINYFILSFFIGLTISIKMNSAVFLMLILFLAYYDYGNRIKIFFKNSHERKVLFYKAFASIMGIFIITGIVWSTHFALGRKLEGYYDTVKQDDSIILKKRQPLGLSNLLNNLSDCYINIKKLSKIVPRTDANSSKPYGWPFGHKSINYRWKKTGEKIQYLYLQINPLIWFIGIVSVILSFIMIGSKLFFGLKITNKRIYGYICLFSILYISYMTAMIMVDRVLYLYHYFIPLVLSMVLAYLVFHYIFEDYIVKNDKLILVSVILLVTGIIVLFYFFSPLTYYRPMSYLEFMRRDWFEFWQLNYLKL